MTLAALVDANDATVWAQPRVGKRSTVWNEKVEIEGLGRVRRVMRLTERTIDAKRQLPIEPQDVLEAWTASLATITFSAKAIITSAKATARTSSSTRSSRPIWIYSACPRASSTRTRWCERWRRWP